MLSDTLPDGIEEPMPAVVQVTNRLKATVCRNVICLLYRVFL